MTSTTTTTATTRVGLVTRGGRQRLSLAAILRDSQVMAVRQLRKTLRRPTYIVFSFIQPVIFVLLFRYIFGGAIDTGPVSYVNFLMPGIIVQTAVFGALVTGLGLTEDLATGVVDRLRSLPMARSAVLFGRTAADLVMNVLTLVVMTAVGLLVGFRPSQPAWQLAAAFLLVLGFSYVFSWISAWVGLSVRNPETAQSAGFIWVFPLTFASSAFVPTDSMPAAVRAFAEVNPVSLAVDAVRALTIGGTSATAPALQTLAWLAGLLVIFVALAVRAFRRA
jgi:ABC-2 type transport system permease protein/oleandomycin transport system permease protein